MTVALPGPDRAVGRPAARLHRAAPRSTARAGDRTPAAFLDLFNHRLISLFYRAWEKYRPFLRARAAARGTAPRRHLFDLIGLGLEPLRDRHTFPDDALPYYAGFFAHRHRPAVVLGRPPGDYFGLPIEVVQFVGQWLPPGAGGPLDPGSAAARTTGWESAWSWATGSGTSRANSGSGSAR